MLLAKWLRDHQRTLCMEGWQQVLRTLWQLASQMLLKSHIWWRACTNQDQSVGFEIGPVSQPLCLSPVEFHFHFSLFLFFVFFPPGYGALPSHSPLSALLSLLRLPLSCCCLASPCLLLGGNQALLWVFKHRSRRMLNYSWDLIFCLGGESPISIPHAGWRLRTHTHTHTVK